MKDTIKPIETIYNGYKFRSRLEARWAVFFDAAGIRYEYEPEGFANTKGSSYLPDFYLPDFSTYAEVKGDHENAWDDVKKIAEMIVWGGPIHRVLILSNIPNDYKDGMWHFPCLYFDGITDKVCAGWWFFQDCSDNEACGEISRVNYFPPFMISKRWKISSLAWLPQVKRKLSFQAVSDCVLRNEKGMRTATYSKEYRGNDVVYNAFDKARMARFEYGVKG